MDQQPPLPKLSKPASALKILIIATAVVVLVLAVLLAGSFLNFSCPLGLLTNQNSYEAGWQAANQKLEESGLLRPEQEEVFTISGIITGVFENQITLKSDPVVVNPLAMQAPESRTVTITEETKIIRQTPKTREKLMAEEEKWQSEMDKLKPEDAAFPPSPPSPYIEEEIKLSDLKTGDKISVTSNQNIKFATTLEAVQIIFTPPVISEPVPPPQE